VTLVMCVRLDTHAHPYYVKYTVTDLGHFETLFPKMYESMNSNVFLKMGDKTNGLRLPAVECHQPVCGNPLIPLNSVLLGRNVKTRT
jgi:hypothetical protein